MSVSDWINKRVHSTICDLRLSVFFYTNTRQLIFKFWTIYSVSTNWKGNIHYFTGNLVYYTLCQVVYSKLIHAGLSKSTKATLFALLF